jgi:hypothetical protein
MCGCIVALLALVSPRLAVFLTWAFTNRMTVAFDSGWVGLLGFFLLPWTTLAWSWMYAPVRGVTGFGWFLVILAFIADLSTYAGSAQSRNKQQRSA